MGTEHWKEAYLASYLIDLPTRPGPNWKQKHVFLMYRTTAICGIAGTRQKRPSTLRYGIISPSGSQRPPTCPCLSSLSLVLPKQAPTSSQEKCRRYWKSLRLTKV